MVNAELTNFVIAVSSLTTGFIITLVSVISRCMVKSRCTNIKCCCVSCDRDVIDENNSIYNTPKSSENNLNF